MIMAINRSIIFNLFFLALFVLFLILSFIIDFFFFIPLICILPFSFKHNRGNIYPIQAKNNLIKKKEDNLLGIKLCPNCKSKILDPNAKFFAQCGIELKYS